MALDLTKALDNGKDRGIQRAKLCVYEFYQSSGNHREDFPIIMRELVFSNDSLTDSVSVQVLGPADLNVTFVLLANEVLDERLPEFTTIIITGTGAWRFYPRTGLIP